MLAQPLLVDFGYCIELVAYGIVPNGIRPGDVRCFDIAVAELDNSEVG